MWIPTTSSCCKDGTMAIVCAEFTLEMSWTIDRGRALSGKLAPAFSLPKNADKYKDA